MAQWVFGRFGSTVGVFECVSCGCDSESCRPWVICTAAVSKNQEFRRGGKLKQTSTKNNKKISQWGDLLSPRIRAPILCIFYGKISSPQLKFLSRFFSGKLFRLRFSGEALNGFVFLCWISQCRSYHTFVQSIFAACAVSWLQYLAIHSIWNKYWRSWS